MRLILTLAPLFLSVILLQLSSGGLGPLDALSGLAEGFSSQQIGLLGSAHFLGFFLGCWWAPRLMGSVGHARAFTAFVVFGLIGLLMHMLIVSPLPARRSADPRPKPRITSAPCTMATASTSARASA